MSIATLVPAPRLAPLTSGPTAADQLTSSCGPSIAVSCLLATFAALAALACAARIRSPRHPGSAAGGLAAGGARAAGWTVAAAVAVGMAVWSTQLAGGVSCQYRGPAAFDPRLTLLSALVVPVATGVGLTVVAADPASGRRLVLGGIVGGAGWSAATFMTIAAMRTPQTVGYDVLLAALSVLMNTGTATVLCWVAFRLGDRWRVALLAALLLGAASRGGYYTALAAVRSDPSRGHDLSPGLDPFALGLVTAAGSTIVLMFIAVAAVGGLIHPRVAGGDVIAWPAATAVVRHARAAAAGRALGAAAAAGTSPTSSPRSTPSPADPVEIAIVVGATAADPAHGDLTCEELSYVGLSCDGLADAVELLAPADGEPADGDIAASPPAIDDVRAAAAAAAGPVRVTRSADGSFATTGAGDGSFLLSALAAAVPDPGLDPTAPPARPEGDEAAAPPGARPFGAALLGQDPGEIVAILVPSAGLSPSAGLGPPAGPGPAAALGPAAAGLAPSTGPALIIDAAAERLDASPAQAGRQDGSAQPDGRLTGPALSFPPPPWCFRATAPECVPSVRSRRDDPGAPTKPLRLGPNRLPR